MQFIQSSSTCGGRRPLVTLEGVMAVDLVRAENYRGDEFYKIEFLYRDSMRVLSWDYKGADAEVQAEKDYRKITALFYTTFI